MDRVLEFALPQGDGRLPSPPTEPNAFPNGAAAIGVEEPKADFPNVVPPVMALALLPEPGVAHGDCAFPIPNQVLVPNAGAAGFPKALPRAPVDGVVLPNTD